MSVLYFMSILLFINYLANDFIVESIIIELIQNRHIEIYSTFLTQSCTLRRIVPDFNTDTRNCDTLADSLFFLSQDCFPMSLILNLLHQADL